MKKLSALFIINFIFMFSAVAETCRFDFDRWNTILNQIQDRAVAEQIDDKIINNTIQDAAFIPKIVWRDKNQPEFKISLEKYVSRMVSPVRIAQGKKMITKYPTLLNKVYKKYNVPPHVIVAFWGMESNYGNYKSHYQLSDAFLTLIYEGRREKFFTEQLIALMKIADKNKLNIDEIYGSWAGAMGHFQFIPTTLIQYGTDGNMDGRIDIINNISDAMFSAGNYLSKMGWNPNEKIIRKVVLPENFDLNLCDGKTKKPLDQWAQMGINGVPNYETIAGLVCDQNPECENTNDVNITSETCAPKYAYLAYPNFYLIKRWNNSNSYAIAIALLAEKLK